MHKSEQNRAIWLRAAAMAAIAAATLSLPPMSIAQAQQNAVWTSAAKRQWAERYRGEHEGLNNATRNPGAYNGHFALPEADPDYHGSNGG
jgi:hypothetical protein